MDRLEELHKTLCQMRDYGVRPTKAQVKDYLTECAKAGRLVESPYKAPKPHVNNIRMGTSAQWGDAA